MASHSEQQCGQAAVAVVQGLPGFSVSNQLWVGSINNGGGQATATVSEGRGGAATQGLKAFAEAGHQ